MGQSTTHDKNHTTRPNNDSPQRDSDETSDVTQGLESMKISQTMTIKPYFRFLDLPAEIRELIYGFTYTLSRGREEIYRIPDFIVHGDGKNKGGIKWMNVERYNLLLVCKQTYNESMPIISAESFFEIKTYSEQDKKAWNAVQILRNSSQLCQNAGKVVIDLTPAQAYRSLPLCYRIFEILTILDGYKKLKEITLKIAVSKLIVRETSGMAGFFVLAKKGVTLLLELSMNIDEWEYGSTRKSQRKVFEKAFHRMTRKFGGDNAEVRFSRNVGFERIC